MWSSGLWCNTAERLYIASSGLKEETNWITLNNLLGSVTVEINIIHL